MAGRNARPEPRPAPPPEVVVSEPEPAVLPDPVLNRSDIIGIAAAAADQFGGGPAAAESFAGRRFMIRIPFGCSAGEGKDDASGWRYDKAAGTLRIAVAPHDWTKRLQPEAAEESEVDAVEGFWVPRPWTSTDRCPATAELGANVEESTVGVAQFFGAESNRAAQRRGRPFEFVAKIAPEELPRAGLQLVIEGRVARVPGGNASALCQAPEPGERPVCIVAAEFDRIAVSDPARGAELANWRP